MKRGIRILVTIALVGALGFGAVQAQEQGQDDFLQRYELAMENLGASVAALPDAASVAREQLDQAMNALRTLSRETDSTTLIAAMERIFERAREAIVNRSAVDLTVQVEVLRGGFQRLVYDAALQAAVEGDLATARDRLQAIANDVGVPEATVSALDDAQQSIAQLRYAFEAGIAESVQLRLAMAREQVGTNLDAAYQSLADAYGDYLLVQDSPRIPGEVNVAFVNAASALVDTEVEPLLAQLGALSQRFATLEEAATEALNAAPGTPEPSAPSQPAELPATQSDAASTPVPADPASPEGDVQDEAAQDAVGQTDIGQADGGQEAAAPDGNAQDAADQEGADAAPAISDEVAAQVAADIAAQERRDRIDALMVELATTGIVADRRADLAAQILDGGYASLEDVVRALHADASEATGALERGLPETARGYVRAYEQRYRQFLAPIVATVAPEADVRTAALTNTLATADGLRLQDMAVLASHAGTLRGVLAGVAPTFAHEAAVDTVRFWAGLVRLLVVVVLGVLAFVPLYLLNLAFGGGNRNWRYVGVALFLLLVPVMYEALAFVADLIAAVTGVDALYAVSQYSMFHNPISQVVWAALTGVAILFAIGGLYGICVQFGLLGRRQEARTTTSSEVRDTVEWDEEF